MKKAGTFSNWIRRRERLCKEIQEASRTGKSVTTISASVPCGDCYACCCHYDVDFDQRFDNPCDYETEIGRTGSLVLKHHEDGSCVYLKDGKCTIYARRPYYCRVYDCRPMAYADIYVINRPDLNAALLQWDPRGFWKTKQDFIALSAYRFAVRKGVLLGETAEESCIKSLEKINDFKAMAEQSYRELAMAEKLYNELRSKP